MRKSVQLGANARRTCPGFGVLCFLFAFFASLLGTQTASADIPPTAIKTAPLAVPATVLGITNPYLVAAAMNTPDVQRFTLSRSIRDLAAQVEKLARYGVDLKPRTAGQTEKLQLRVEQRGAGGVFQICYRR